MDAERVLDFSGRAALAQRNMHVNIPREIEHLDRAN